MTLCKQKLCIKTHASVTRQKSEFLDGDYKKTKNAKFSQKPTFPIPCYARTCTYQEVRNNSFFGKFGVLCFLVATVDSPFRLLTDGWSICLDETGSLSVAHPVYPHQPRSCHTTQSTGFCQKQCFFSTQPQFCLTFSWIELQMLLRCCLIHLSTIILCVFMYISRFKSIYVACMRSIFRFYLNCHYNY